jgi:catechol 2,3-dioxygenase-like lactoylglutathione lyase family enzyme
MSLILHQTFLPATDPEKSLAFYRDALGFDVRNDVSFGGMRWITIGPADQPQTSIVLEPPMTESHPDLTDEERSAVASLMAKGSYARIVLGTENLTDVFDRVQATGADVVQEPTDQPYGVRDCAFRDPAGNLVRINQL